TFQSSHPDNWVKRAEAFSYLGDDKGVLDCVREATEALEGKFTAGDAVLLHLAAAAECRLDRAEAAETLWKRVLKLAPGFDLARENLQDMRRPVGKRHAPWPYSLPHWVRKEAVDGLMQDLMQALGQGDEEGDPSPDKAQKFLDR